MMKKYKLVFRSMTCLIALAFLAAACETTGQSTGAGALLGGALGAVIGNQSGHAWEGAAIGAAVGGLTGYIVGKVKEQRQLKTLETREAEIRQSGGTVPAQPQITVEDLSVMPVPVKRGEAMDVRVRYDALGPVATAPKAYIRMTAPDGTQVPGSEKVEYAGGSNGLNEDTFVYQIPPDARPGDYVVVTVMQHGGVDSQTKYTPVRVTS